MASYVKFLPSGQSPSSKTRVWDVVAEENSFPLGKIRYFSRWHQYAFFPNGNTVFEKICLRDIAEFCDLRSIEHRRGIAAKRRSIRDVA